MNRTLYIEIIEAYKKYEKLAYITLSISEKVAVLTDRALVEMGNYESALTIENFPDYWSLRIELCNIGEVGKPLENTISCQSWHETVLRAYQWFKSVQ